jgi:hypothetical protein
VLDLLDVAIGFATVMLAVSLIITALTQATVAFLGLRGRNLRLGLQQLIETTLPGLRSHAEKISLDIVSHPLISDSAVGKGRWGWATAIKRDELLPVLKAVLTEEQFVTHVEQNRAAVIAWFESFMTRVSQWFVMHTRWITVGLAVVLAIALELDSGAVLQRIRTDSDTRARLSGMAGVLIDQTPDVLQRVETIYGQALTRTVADHADAFTATPDANALPTPTRDEGVDWIRNHVKPGSEAGPLVEAYNTAVDAALKTSLERSVDRARTIAGNLAAGGVILSPAAIRAGPNPLTKQFWASRLFPASHFFGILVSIVFLSLGAPFWFNVLKNLTSLRSTVAQRAAPPASETAPAPPLAPPAEAGAVRARGWPEIPPAAPVVPLTAAYSLPDIPAPAK